MGGWAKALGRGVSMWWRFGDRRRAGRGGVAYRLIVSDRTTPFNSRLVVVAIAVTRVEEESKVKVRARINDAHTYEMVSNN